MSKRKRHPMAGSSQQARIEQSEKRLFSARSRGAFANHKQPLIEPMDTRVKNEMVFNVWLEAMDFAGSLLDKPDQRHLHQRFPELYAALQDYRLHRRDIFEPERQQEVLTFINDLAAGVYDVGDAFLNCRAEYRPQLLHLVKNFVSGKITMTYEDGQIPPSVLESSLDDMTPLRIFGEYYELGFRISAYNVKEQEASRLYWEKAPLGATAENVYTACHNLLHEINGVQQLPVAGIAYKYFSLDEEAQKDAAIPTPDLNPDNLQGVWAISDSPTEQASTSR